MRLICALLALLAWAWLTPACAAIVGTVLGTSSTLTAGTSITITTGADAPVGSKIVVMVTAAGNVDASIAAGDNVGGASTYTKASTICTYNTTYRVYAFYHDVLVDVPSSSTITVQWSGSLKASAGAVQGTGLATGGPDVQGACATSANNAPAASIATGALGANELVVAILGINSTAASYASNSPFTDGGSLLTNNPSFGWGYDVAAAGAGVTFGPSLGTSRANGANVWAFKEPSAASACARSLLGVGC